MFGWDVKLRSSPWLRKRGDAPLVAELKPPGYECKSFPRCGSKGGGIAVIFKTTLEKHITLCDNFPFVYECFEILKVSVR